MIKTTPPMPFKSVAQMNTCFARRPKGWKCEEWLAKTNICVLPFRSEDKQISETKATKKPDQPAARLGPILVGPRGGRYREVKQGKCVKKLYLSSS